MPDDIKPDPKPKKDVAPAPVIDPAPPAPTEPQTHPLDGVLKDVENASDVRAAVRVLVEKLGDEFASPELQERAGAFADAVGSKVPDPAADGALKAPAPATDDDVARLEAINHAEPHNEAAAAAVAGGMDTKTANEMTAPGANI